MIHPADTRNPRTAHDRLLRALELMDEYAQPGPGGIGYVMSQREMLQLAQTQTLIGLLQVALYGTSPIPTSDGSPT